MSNTKPVNRAYNILENVVFLKKTQLFSSMWTHDLRAVAAIAEELVFDSGEEIMREKDIGDSLYIIKDGSVRVSKMVGSKDAIDLATLVVGDSFGDMAVFDAELRSASGYALGRCTLLRIQGDDLIDVILDCPNIAIELLKIFVKRLRNANVTIESLSATAQRNVE